MPKEVHKITHEDISQVNVRREQEKLVLDVMLKQGAVDHKTMHPQFDQLDTSERMRELGPMALKAIHHHTKPAEAGPRDAQRAANMKAANVIAQAHNDLKQFGKLSDPQAVNDSIEIRIIFPGQEAQMEHAQSSLSPQEQSLQDASQELATAIVKRRTGESMSLEEIHAVHFARLASYVSARSKGESAEDALPASQKPPTPEKLSGVLAMDDHQFLQQSVGFIDALPLGSQKEYVDGLLPGGGMSELRQRMRQEAGISPPSSSQRQAIQRPWHQEHAVQPRSESSLASAERNLQEVSAGMAGIMDKREGMQSLSDDEKHILHWARLVQYAAQREKGDPPEVAGGRSNIPPSVDELKTVLSLSDERFVQHSAEFMAGVRADQRERVQREYGQELAPGGAIISRHQNLRRLSQAALTPRESEAARQDEPVARAAPVADRSADEGDAVDQRGKGFGAWWRSKGTDLNPEKDRSLTYEQRLAKATKWANTPPKDPAEADARRILAYTASVKSGYNEFTTFVQVYKGEGVLVEEGGLKKALADEGTLLSNCRRMSNPQNNPFPVRDVDKTMEVVRKVRDYVGAPELGERVPKMAREIESLKPEHDVHLANILSRPHNDVRDSLEAQERHEYQRKEKAYRTLKYVALVERDRMSPDRAKEQAFNGDWEKTKPTRDDLKVALAISRDKFTSHVHRLDEAVAQDARMLYDGDILT